MGRARTSGAAGPQRSARRSLVAFVFACLGLGVLVLPAPAPAEPLAASGQASPPSGQEILERAFANRYELDATVELELKMYSGKGKMRRRVLEAAMVDRDGEYKAIGQLTYPEHVRGMTVLTVSQHFGRLDSFVYLPSLKKARRISTTHRDDSFLGSDLTYEDFERRYPEAFTAELAAEIEVEAEPAFVLDCKPLTRVGYDRVEFVVAKRDYALLEIREFRGAGSEPARVMRASRKDMIDVGGHVLSTKLEFTSPWKGTRTEVVLRHLREETLSRAYFTVSALERQPDLRRILGRRSLPQVGAQ